MEDIMVLKNTTVRDLRYKFPQIEESLRAGQEIQITKHKRVIARLLPPKDVTVTGKVDYMARLKQIYGEQVLAVSGAELLAAEREERF